MKEQPPESIKDLTDAAMLEALAAGLCQDAGVGMEIYPGPWSWDPVRRVILVNQKDLEQHGPDWCAGVLANEIGHFYLTRYPLFAVDFPSKIAGELVLDALEDPRVDQWMMDRYPGIERWHEAAYDHATPINSGQPDFLSFVMAIANEARAMLGVTPVVGRAFEESWLARQHYAAMTPATEFVRHAGKALRARYKLQVWPALITPRWVPPAHEQAVQVSAIEALRFAEREILPIAEEVFLADVEAIEKYLNDKPARAARARRLIDDNEARELMYQARHHPGKKPLTSRWAHDLAFEAVEAMLTQDRPRRLIQRVGIPSMGGDPSILPPPPPPDMAPIDPMIWYAPTDYDKALNRVSRQIDRLTRDLESMIKPRQRLRERSGYPSGRHIDLRRLLAFEADPRRYNELWVRSSIPDRRDVAVTLLVDLSGSMSGQKVQAALLGTILLAETLNRLDVPFAVTGFQDVLIPLRSFDQPFDDLARRAIAEIPQEVAGSRHGGNNQPGYNDDGPCLLEAAEDLLAFPAADHMLIVVSDGLPEGRRSNRGDLTKAVATIVSEARRLDLIGLGLGTGTNHVKTYYPESVANVPIDRFSDEIAKLIERVLLGS